LTRTSLPLRAPSWSDSVCANSRSSMCVCTCLRCVCARVCVLYIERVLYICELQVCMTHAVLHVSSSSYANYRSV
jgi:hypothetical protein